MHSLRRSLVVSVLMACASASASGMAMESGAKPPSEPHVSRLGGPSFEVDVVTLERDGSGELKAEGVARWATLASQGFRVTQSVTDGGRLVLVLERTIRGGANAENYIPAAVRGNPAVAEQLSKALRENRPVTLTVTQPPAPVVPGRNGPEGKPHTEGAPKP